VIAALRGSFFVEVIMKFKVVKGCVINGAACKVGEIIEIASADELKALMGVGRVEPHDEPVVKDRSIGLDEETKPKRRARKKPS